MKLIAPTWLAALALTVAADLHAQDTVYYVEADGVVAFDPEDSAIEPDWELRTELTDYIGTGYLEWTGPGLYNSSKAGTGGHMTFHFQINTPGNYQIRWRNRIALGDMSTEHNDSWLRLATGTDVLDEEPLSGWTKVYMNNLNGWVWDARTVDHVGRPLRQYFGVGDM